MIEVLKQALEAWQTSVYGSDKHHKAMLLAMTKMNQAIAEWESQERNFCSRCGKRTNDIHTCTPPQRKEQEPVAYDKTELNCFAQDLYDQKMREGKRGHYESMFHVIHQCVKKVASPPQRTWVGLTDEEIIDVIHPLVMADMSDQATDYEMARAIEAKLKERNNA
jgi:hypothetical protein